ncbi:MAG: HEAT repeat domain-containing protein [Saprospiraceae bacterium]|nr:HEAT repeat domain-containing protein [Saprospiraceae bacterium]
MDPSKAASMAQEISKQVSAEVHEDFELALWAVDSLVADPIALKVDLQGRVFVTRTNRQKNSEFDIRGYAHWETESIKMQSTEERRAFLHRVLAPELSDSNTWLADLNFDSLHDWRDLAVQKEQVFRIVDESGDGVADMRQLYIEDFHEEITDVAGALLVTDEDVFLGVGPDMWRLRDLNGDGMADSKESISHGYAVHIGFGGHGMSGATIGPDGRIWWGIGDIGYNGVDQDGEKHTYPNRGVIVRANSDGSDFEVFAHGVRNTHEFVFDQYGNLISVDNDGDHPGEHERLVYIVNGSDSGWRINWQFGKYSDPKNNRYKVWMDEQLFKPRFDGQAAYITPCIRNYVNGPTGMLYNPGTALSEKWQDWFFIVEFNGSPARSNLHAFQLEPKGATFEFVRDEKILNGVLATGIDFGPDGAMYVADWIDGWNTKDYGRIWKLDVIDGEKHPLRSETQSYLIADFGERSTPDLGILLAHTDMRVRLKAQFELVNRGDEGAATFDKAITQVQHQLARIHGIWGTGQLAHQHERYAKPLGFLLSDADPEIRAQAAKILGDLRHRGFEDELIGSLSDTTLRVRFFAAEALGRMAYKPAVDALITMLIENDDQDAYLRHAGSLALARIGETEPLAALANHPSRSLRIAAVVALRRMQAPEIGTFLEDADEFILTEVARAINDDFSIPDALPALGNILLREGLTAEALVRRAINANLRVGSQKALQNVMDYVQKDFGPPAMIEEAIHVLGVWHHPSVLDRVDGRYRGSMQREITDVQDAAGHILQFALDHSSAGIRLAAAQAIGNLKLHTAAGALVHLLEADVDNEVRTTALKALSQLETDAFEDALTAAFGDENEQVRVKALELIGAQDLSDQKKAELLTGVMDVGSISEQQAAIQALGKLPATVNNPILGDLFDQYEEGSLPSVLRLDVAEAVSQSGAENLVARLASIKKSSDEFENYKDCLEGGSAAAGRSTFIFDQGAQCMKCHMVGQWGGDAGPPLTDLGAERSRKQILRSLVQPSHEIVPGYGVVTVTLQTGDVISGILLAESEESLTLRTSDEEEREISIEEIDERIDAISSMPGVRNILDKREIRDLLEFLTTLNSKVPPV